MFLLIFVAYLILNTNALYSPTSGVVDLTASNFDKHVLKEDEVWIVKFYAPWCGHCQQFVSEYEKVAKALKGVVKVGAVNAEEYTELSNKYHIGGYPTVKIFGGNKNKPEDYKGKRIAQDLVDAALTVIRNKVKRNLERKTKSTSGKENIIQLNDSNFEELVLNSNDTWLVEFFAPWCAHCNDLEPNWAAAAKELKEQVKFGALDGTVNSLIPSKYEIDAYPTIKYFPSGAKIYNLVENYDGGRHSSEIVQWVLTKLSENIPNPEILEIVSQESFNNECEEKHLCVVTVLPHILDCQAECRTQYLELLRDVAEKYKKMKWGWLWVEAGAQMELENAFDIGGFGYPAVTVVNYKKMKYSLLRGSFSKKNIEEFLNDLSLGRNSKTPVSDTKLPNIYSRDGWDGKDGELPKEEDFDLSDVDLNAKDEL